jgi:hypothetical protein
MANTTISEDVLQQIFARRGDFTSQAKFWSLPFEANQPQTYPTIYVKGDVSLNIGGEVTHFPEGAYVFERDGKLQSMPSRNAGGGNITVEGGPPRPMTTNVHTNIPEGNLASLRFENGRLSLTPDQRRPGFSFQYPAPSAEELVEAAARENRIVTLKDADTGREIRGFFSEGSSGIRPNEIQPYMAHTDIRPGQFWSINESVDANGKTTTRLFPYQEYTQKELTIFTQHGKYAPPGNQLNRLTTVDGLPVNPKSFSSLDVTKVPVTTGDVVAVGAAKPVEGAVVKAPDGSVAARGPEGGAEAAAQTSTKAGKVLQIVGKGAPFLVFIPPLIEGTGEAIDAEKKGGNLLEVTGSALLGAGKGLVHTVLPGASEGYNHVIGNKNLTLADRVLNAANDATGTAVAVGSLALVAETVGVVTIPATAPTAIATLAWKPMLKNTAKIG